MNIYANFTDTFSQEFINSIELSVDRIRNMGITEGFPLLSGRGLSVLGIDDGEPRDVCTDFHIPTTVYEAQKMHNQWKIIKGGYEDRAHYIEVLMDEMCDGSIFNHLGAFWVAVLHEGGTSYEIQVARSKSDMVFGHFALLKPKKDKGVFLAGEVGYRAQELA